MERQPLYAFYGSLRRGMQNYVAFKDALHYCYYVWVPGFYLVSLGDYPAAIPSSPNDYILTEVFHVIDKSAEQKIIDLEHTSGYEMTEVFLFNEPVKIFVFKSGENFPKVEGGDWVTFFRQQTLG